MLCCAVLCQLTGDLPCHEGSGVVPTTPSPRCRPHRTRCTPKVCLVCCQHELPPGLLVSDGHCSVFFTRLRGFHATAAFPTFGNNSSTTAPVRCHPHLFFSSKSTHSGQLGRGSPGRPEARGHLRKVGIVLGVRSREKTEGQGAALGTCLRVLLVKC